MTGRQNVRSAYISSSSPVVEQRPARVIYLVQPDSFRDSNGDGHGDFRGITSQLDYIKSLNVDDIWFNPPYKAPPGKDGDNRYAPSDTRNIDEALGTMQDFEEFIDEAHKRGLRVYMDFMVCHTSHEHEWFQKSRNREPGFEDVYVWRDGWKVQQAPGLEPPPNAKHREHEFGEHWEYNEKTKLWAVHYPPNNWKSVFGGSAWSWDDARGQFYQHNFLKSQPALNNNLEKVQDMVMGEMDFWRAKGVNGFRLDALSFANHDDEFNHDGWRDGCGPNDNYEYWNQLKFTHSICQPQTIEFCERMREHFGDDFILLGEAIAGPDGGGGCIPIAATYVQPKTGIGESKPGIHMCYTDALNMWGYPSAEDLRDKVSYLLSQFPADGGHCNSVDNHDSWRSATRLLGNVAEEERPQALRQMMQLFATLPGSVQIMQGTELGLPQARIPQDIKWNEAKDPTAIEGVCEGRDGSRTPMPWNNAEKNAGFSTSDTPHLPVPQSHYPLAVNLQDADPNSLLNFQRAFFAWRREQPALITGQTTIIDNPDGIFARLHQSEKQIMLSLFNMTNCEQSFTPSRYLDPTLLGQLGLEPGQKITVQPRGAAYPAALLPEPAAVAEPTRPMRAPVAPQLAEATAA